MRIAAFCGAICLGSSIAEAEIRPESEIGLSELTSSLALGVGYASGWTLDEIAQLIPKFAGANAFEDRRLRTDAVNKVVGVGQGLKETGFRQLVYRIGRIDLGEYSFNERDFSICLPWYGGAAYNDIPTNGVKIEFDLGESHFASHASFTNSGESCGVWALDGMRFSTAPLELKMPDDATAERFFNEVQKDGGKISAAIVCNFDRLERLEPGPMGSLVCSYEGLYLSFGGEGFDPNRVFYTDQLDPTTKERSVQLLFK